MRELNDLSEKELESLLNRKRSENSKSQKNKLPFSSIIVTIIVILNTLFTMATLYLFKVTGDEPTLLIGAWFSFTTVELFSLAKIKREKIKIQGDDIDESRLD